MRGLIQVLVHGTLAKRCFHDDTVNKLTLGSLRNPGGGGKGGKKAKLHTAHKAAQARCITRHKVQEPESIAQKEA